MSTEGAAGVIAVKKFKPQGLIKTSAEFIDGFVPPDYLFDGILQRRFIYSLTGQTGSGKSAILLLLAAHAPLGRPIGAREVEMGRVLYFAGENPDDIRMRWIAMSEFLNFDPDDIAVHFIPGTFKISEMSERIKQEAAAVGPFTLVIVDTSAAFFEGDDENSNTQQGVHARRLRGLVGISGGPCVVVACHPPKNAMPGNLQPRGGGAFIAEMDGNLTASNEDGIVELHWQGKFRGPDFAPLSFKLQTVTHQRLKDTRGRTIPTVLASHVSDEAREEIAAALRGNENRVLEAIADKPGASLAEIARGLGWIMKSGHPDKMKVKRAVAKLKAAKLITMDRDKPVIADKGLKEIGRATAKAANGQARPSRSTATAACYDTKETQQ